MVPPRGSAAYKKKDGTLALSKDSKSVSWTPVAPPGSKPAMNLPVSSITNLQQTPASSTKVMLKIFEQAPRTSAQETHVFSFTSATSARAEADAIRDALSQAIQASKSGETTLAALDGGSSSAAMAIASAISSKSGPMGEEASFFDDARLKQDVELQQSLLKSNSTLSKTFVETLRTKPESISSSQLTSQFWSTRIQLLRAHAIERSQTRGAYNVLSSINPTTVDNTTTLSISKEQIQLIFNQHPLVRRAYDENVPKISEEAFWSRFFLSRLFKKLKGERTTDADPTDNVLDRYLQYDEDTERARRLMAAHVPHIIDVEGNEENHSQRKGNQPDLTMRPTSIDRVPIIRTLNALSEKILSHVAPNDIDPSLPIGVDEETFNSLALRDLEGDAEENRVVLNIKDQSRFFNSDREPDVSADALLYAKQNPSKVLKSLQSDLARLTSSTDLSTAIGVDSESDSSDDESNPEKAHVGSKSSRSAATAQMLSAIASQRVQNEELSISSAGFSTVATSSTSGLSSAIFDRLALTHATTTEFLSHFWNAFLSGEPSRANEIGQLLETLNRAMERIKAVADDAEKERQKEVDKFKKQVQDFYERTGKRRRFDYDSVAGGAKAVNTLLGPTVKAVEVATREYGRALKEQGGTEDTA
ncbi:RNA polymerase II transcription factor B subunit 1 [Puttea exsequens]|nr:RNA polymerase II transcription factor B subunit 1 [Puttea exsequens]